METLNQPEFVAMREESKRKKNEGSSLKLQSRKVAKERDEIFGAMLAMPPQPHKPRGKKKVSNR